MIDAHDPRLSNARMAFHHLRNAHQRTRILALLRDSLHVSDFAAIARTRTDHYRSRHQLAQAHAALHTHQTQALHLIGLTHLPWSAIMRTWTHQLVIHTPGGTATMATTNLTPDEFADNNRLHFSTGQLRQMPDLGSEHFGGTLVWSEEANPDEAVRVWFYPAELEHGHPFPNTATIERRTLDPDKGYPTWRVEVIYNADDLTQTAPTA